MEITRQTWVFDAPDMAVESAFWAALLGGTVEQSDWDWHSVVVDGQHVVAVQLAPDLVPPDWPAGAPQQVHVDLHVADIHSAHEEVLALGARLLQDGNRDQKAGFLVYADPAGHPFCLCWD